MFVDTDAFFLEHDVSIDAYLERAHVEARDEALVDDRWQLLFSSNAPFRPWDALCSGVFWLRNTATSCGVLRNWWDAEWTHFNQRHPFEQAAMSAGVHRFNRAYGDLVRVMPSASFFHHERTAGRKAAFPLDSWMLHAAGQCYSNGGRSGCSLTPWQQQMVSNATASAGRGRPRRRGTAPRRPRSAGAAAAGAA